MFRGSRGTQTTSLRVSVNPQSIQRGGEETYRVPRIGRASNSDSTQQKGVFTMGQGIGTGEPTLIDSIYDDEAAPTAEQVAKVVAKVAGAGAGNTLQGRRIAVVGLGYVGLPTALSLADHGAQIIGCDISESRLAEIKSRRVDLLDRDRERLARHLQGELVKLTTEPSAVVERGGDRRLCANTDRCTPVTGPDGRCRVPAPTWSTTPSSARPSC